MSAGEHFPLPPLRRWAPAVLIALLVSTSAQPALGKHNDKRRDELRREREAIERELDVVRATDTEVQVEVNRLTKAVARQSARVGDARQAVRAAEAALADNRRRAERLAAQVASARALVVSRAVAAYTRPHATLVDSVAGSRSVTEVSRRTTFLAAAQADTADAIDALAAARSDLDDAVSGLQAAEAAARERSKAEREALALLDTARRRQQAVEDELDRRIADLRAESEALAAQQARIEEIIRVEAAAAAATLARQREAKAAQEAAARASGARPAPPVGGAASARGLIWPVRGRISSEFGPRWGGFHSGIDIANAAGTPIVASKDGVVVFSGWMDGYGLFVLLDHGEGLVTGYAHQSRLAAEKGATVDRGGVIGYVGSTGRSTGNHLHFEVRDGGAARNPRLYLP